MTFQHVPSQAISANIKAFKSGMPPVSLENSKPLLTRLALIESVYKERLFKYSPLTITELLLQLPANGGTRRLLDTARRLGTASLQGRAAAAQLATTLVRANSQQLHRIATQLVAVTQLQCSLIITRHRRIVHGAPPRIHVHRHVGLFSRRSHLSSTLALVARRRSMPEKDALSSSFRQ